MTKVFIDGSAGTTGLQIRNRLENRQDLTLLTLPEELRKDLNARQDIMNTADIVFLCLPDAAAREAVTLIENPQVRVIDTSTAHRVNPDWVYGFPELGYRERIEKANRIANPGCHATGFLSIAAPLVKTGMLPADALLSCFSLTGYSGGGKQMIAQYEAEDADVSLTSPGIYGLNQAHKHLPEMQIIGGLTTAPIFSPIVDHYYKGMATTIPFHGAMVKGSMEDVKASLMDFYAGSPLISVVDADAKIYGNTLSGSDRLELLICGNDERFTVTALFDNLGKGASGAAIENMNIALGVDPTTGLNL